MARHPKSPSDYNVGYGRPPKSHQFQPGCSGNPAGQRKRDCTLDELILREGRRVVKLTAGDESVKMTKAQALVRKLFNIAMAGDVTAIRLWLNQTANAHAREAGEPAPELPLTAEEIALLELLSGQSGGSK